MVSDSLFEHLDANESRTISDEAKANVVRTKFFDALQDAFAEYDVIITPTMASTGLELTSDSGLDFERFLTWPLNWSGHPASSVPVGRDSDGHPVGMQVVAPRYEDDIILAVSSAYENVAAE